MDAYKPNSNRFKSEQRNSNDQNKKKIKKVASGKIKEPSRLTKVVDFFLADNIENMKNDILMDVVRPAVKKTISSTVDRIFIGGDSKKKTGTSDKISYREYYEDGDRRYKTRKKEHSISSYDQIELETRAEADMVIEQLLDIIDVYGVATVADLYDMVDMTSDHTANKYGWTGLKTARSVRLKDGMYGLVLPKAKPI